MTENQSESPWSAADSPFNEERVLYVGDKLIRCVAVQYDHPGIHMPNVSSFVVFRQERVGAERFPLGLVDIHYDVEEVSMSSMGSFLETAKGKKDLVHEGTDWYDFVDSDRRGPKKKMFVPDICTTLWPFFGGWYECNAVDIGGAAEAIFGKWYRELYESLPSNDLCEPITIKSQVEDVDEWYFCKGGSTQIAVYDSEETGVFVEDFPPYTNTKKVVFRGKSKAWVIGAITRHNFFGYRGLDFDFYCHPYVEQKPSGNVFRSVSRRLNLAIKELMIASPMTGNQMSDLLADQMIGIVSGSKGSLKDDGTPTLRWVQTGAIVNVSDLVFGVTRALGTDRDLFEVKLLRDLNGRSDQSDVFVGYVEDREGGPHYGYRKKPGDKKSSFTWHRSMVYPTDLKLVVRDLWDAFVKHQ